MLKEMKKDFDYLYINYEPVKKYGTQIKLVIDKDVIFEGEIFDNLKFKLKSFKIGKFARLYVKINNVYLFLDKEIISYDIIRLSVDQISIFIQEFFRDVEDVLNAY